MNIYFGSVFQPHSAILFGGAPRRKVLLVDTPVHCCSVGGGRRAAEHWSFPGEWEIVGFVGWD